MVGVLADHALPYETSAGILDRLGRQCVAQADPVVCETRQEAALSVATVACEAGEGVACFWLAFTPDHRALVDISYIRRSCEHGFASGCIAIGESPPVDGPDGTSAEPDSPAAQIARAGQPELVEQCLDTFRDLDYERETDFRDAIEDEWDDIERCASDLTLGVAARPLTRRERRDLVRDYERCFDDLEDAERDALEEHEDAVDEYEETCVERTTCEMPSVGHVVGDNLTQMSVVQRTDRSRCRYLVSANFGEGPTHWEQGRTQVHRRCAGQDPGDFVFIPDSRCEEPDDDLAPFRAWHQESVERLSSVSDQLALLVVPADIQVSPYADCAALSPDAQFPSVGPLTLSESCRSILQDGQANEIIDGVFVVSDGPPRQPARTCLFGTEPGCIDSSAPVEPQGLAAPTTTEPEREPAAGDEVISAPEWWIASPSTDGVDIGPCAGNWELNERSAAVLATCDTIEGDLQVREPIELPYLRVVEGDFYLSGGEFALPSLERVDGSFSVSSGATVIAPVLDSVGRLNLSSSNESFIAPSLEIVTGSVNVGRIREFIVPQLREIQGDFVFGRVGGASSHALELIDIHSLEEVSGILEIAIPEQSNPNLIPATLRFQSLTSAGAVLVNTDYARTVEFPALHSAGQIVAQHSENLQNLDFPSLVGITGQHSAGVGHDNEAFRAYGLPNLQSVAVPVLFRTYGTVALVANPNLAEVDLSALEEIHEGGVSIRENRRLTTFAAPALVSAESVRVDDCPALESVNLAAVDSLGSLVVDDNDGLVEVILPATFEVRLLSIEGNDSFPTCDAQAIADSVDARTEDVGRNAPDRCGM